jgi:hypothetical protein
MAEAAGDPPELIESAPVRESTPEEVAYHEAGHAVVGARLGLQLVDVDVLPDPEGGHGHTNFRAPDWYRPGLPEGSAEERRFSEAVVVTFLAGTAAEARFAGFSNRDSAGFDLDRVAREWLGRLDGPDQVAMARRAAELVESHWPAIERLALALQGTERMTAEEALAAAG